MPRAQAAPRAAWPAQTEPSGTDRGRGGGRASPARGPPPPARNAAGAGAFHVTEDFAQPMARMSPATTVKGQVMAFELPPLPYPTNALEPYTSARTLEFHHGKHHQTYVTTLNKLVEGSPMARQSLEELIKSTHKDQSKTAVFNNAAQVWNHTFFWNCMKPNGGGAPKGDIAQAIERDLGGIAKFEEEFKKAATGQFGSGWAWLVADNGKLKITHTPNAGNPIA